MAKIAVTANLRGKPRDIWVETDSLTIEQYKLALQIGIGVMLNTKQIDFSCITWFPSKDE